MERSSREIVFVAGATGYVGRHVVQALCEREVDCVAHLRPSDKSTFWHQHFAAMGAQVRQGEWKGPAIRAVLEQVAPTHIFALLGTTRALAKRDQISGDIYEAVDYGLVHMLLAACKGLPVPARFVYLSSVGATLESSSAYLRARGRIEGELDESGLSWMSAQPSIITGHDRDKDRPFERVGAQVGDFALRVASRFGGAGLQSKYASTSAQQLSHALVELGLSDKLGIVGGEALRAG